MERLLTVVGTAACNMCSSSPCPGPEFSCVPSFNSYSCVCAPGLTGTNCEFRTFFLGVLEIYCNPRMLTTSQGKDTTVFVTHSDLRRLLFVSVPERRDVSDDGSEHLHVLLSLWLAGAAVPVFVFSSFESVISGNP